MSMIVVWDEGDPNEVTTAINAETNEAYDIEGIHGLVRALQRLEAKMRQDMVFEEVKPGYIMGRKTLLGMPLLQPSKEETVEALPAQHPLASFIAHAIHKQRVGDKILEKLTARVDLGDLQTLPSPTEWWDITPDFKQFCIEKRDYWLSLQVQDVMHLVNLIRSYGTPVNGWLEWRETHQDKPNVDTSNIPFADI